MQWVGWYRREGLPWRRACQADSLPMLAPAERGDAEHEDPQYGFHHDRRRIPIRCHARRLGSRGRRHDRIVGRRWRPGIHGIRWTRLTVAPSRTSRGSGCSRPWPRSTAAKA